MNRRTAEGVGHRLELRAAHLADADLLLRWRNDPETRTQSFSQAVVRQDEHMRWLRRKLAAPDETRIYIAKRATALVGQARVDRLDAGIGEISVSVDSAHRGQGLGSELIALATARAADELHLQTIRAVVKPANQASLRAFERAGYGEARTTRRENEPVVLNWHREG